jgi:hypothetical protein
MALVPRKSVSNNTLRTIAILTINVRLWNMKMGHHPSPSGSKLGTFWESNVAMESHPFKAGISPQCP